jgi:hypothetical protein
MLLLRRESFFISCLLLRFGSNTMLRWSFLLAVYDSYPGVGRGTAKSWSWSQCFDF